MPNFLDNFTFVSFCVVKLRGMRLSWFSQPWKGPQRWSNKHIFTGDLKNKIKYASLYFNYGSNRTEEYDFTELQDLLNGPVNKEIY